MSESGTPEATHFRCAYHDEVLPADGYQQHCDEKHGGNLIAVEFVTPEAGTPEARNASSRVARPCDHCGLMIHENDEYAYTPSKPPRREHWSCWASQGVR